MPIVEENQIDANTIHKIHSISTEENKNENEFSKTKQTQNEKNLHHTDTQTHYITYGKKNKNTCTQC